MHIFMQGTTQELQQLQSIIGRATNTLEPAHWPDWLVALDKVAGGLAQRPESLFARTGMEGHSIVSIVKVDAP